MTNNDRELIFIPYDGNYIEILGHRIDGFDSFESFCEHLKKYAELEETVNRQKAEIQEQRENIHNRKAEANRLNSKIRSLKVEIERLKGYVTPTVRLLNEYDVMMAKAEAIAGFVEKLNQEVGCFGKHLTQDEINNLAKESLGVSQEKSSEHNMIAQLFHAFNNDALRK